ncbi:MAG: hypothetical protein Q7T80_17295 [Methanoregula sp.]|nr:hypothetical protein [Methanoregula sp.]
MTNNDKHPSLVWAISACLLAMVFLVPLSSATDGERLNATLIRSIISENITDQSYDFIFSGDHILWRNVYDQSRTDGLYGGLYLYSLRDNSTRPIATETASGDKWINWQTMSDNTIVWNQYPGILHLYNIRSGEERKIPDLKSNGAQKTYSWNGERDIERWMPIIDGDRVVWFQGFPSGTYANADIFLLNLTTNEVIPVNESPSAKGGLAMNGNRVVWYTHSEKRDGRETEIYLHDLATGADTVVCSDPGLQMQTVISEKYIAWTDSHDPLSVPLPLSQIHIYTISDRTTRTIPTTTMNQYNPFFAEDYVVYTECTPYEKSVNERTCDSKIFDILTGTTREFPSSRNNQNTNGDYEYNRKVHGFSDGQFLIEEIRDGKREFGLYRIENFLQAAKPIGLADKQIIPAGNVTVTGSSTLPLPSTQPAPGFGIMSIILTFLTIGIILRKGGRNQ